MAPDKKKTLTLVIETDGSDDCRWIFKSFSHARIAPHEAKKYGLTVRNIEDGNVLAKCREAEEDRDTFANQNEEYEGLLNSKDAAITELMRRIISLEDKNKDLQETIDALKRAYDQDPAGVKV